MRTKKRAAESGLEEILGSYLPQAREYFDDPFIGKHAALLKQIAEHCGAETGWAYHYLPKDLIPEQERFLLALAEHCGAKTGWAYHHLPKDLVPGHADLLLALAEHCGAETGWAYRYLPKDLVPDHADFLLALAERCGAETGRAYDSLPKDLIPEQERFLLTLAERCGAKTGDAYESLPKDLVPDHADFLLALAEHCGERTGTVYRYLLRDLTLEQAERVFRIGKEQGITHFDRYFMNHNFPLKECTLDALTKASPQKPLAVIIHNKNDNNEVFSNVFYITELLHVLDHYSVCLFEADNRTEAFEYIKRAATASKKPRKISLLVLGGHGTPYSLNLGKTDDTEYADDERKQLEREQERYFSILDTARFAEMGRYVAPRGKIVLVSCSTGRYIPNGKNLAQVIAENIPHATVYAPQVDTHLKRFVIDNGKLTDVEYNCGSELTVKLCGGVSGQQKRG